MMKKTLLLGILNITPDSYYALSRALTVDAAVDKALAMQSDGADILDIGAESTRPGSQPVSEEEELRRVIPVIECLKEKIAIPLSIDTYKPRVAYEAVKAGASFINDISGFGNKDMVAVAAKFQTDVCLMHMQGTPQTMQANPHYPEGVVAHLLSWFEEKTKILIKNGVSREKIILDPGIGFGKTVAHNIEIIQNLRLFEQLGFRLLLGISRKSFLSKLLNQPTENLLPATIAVNTVAMAEGVDFIRVHDVKEHREAIDILYHLKRTL